MVRSRHLRLTGRRRECGQLDRLVADVMGRSRVLVLRGEAGIGKSALLAYVARQVGDRRVISAMGVESEMELAYAGLHQLCSPILDGLEQLPVPQRNALATVFLAVVFIMVALAARLIARQERRRLAAGS